jgi:capsular polysaccharide biosynthesis protein
MTIKREYVEDEIDLYELWTKLLKYKVMIFAITVMSTSGTAIYLNIENNTPSYVGSALIEIGKMRYIPLSDISAKEQSNSTQVIEPAQVTIDILMTETQADEDMKISPIGDDFVHIIYNGKNKELIQQKINSLIKLILERHHKMLASYSKVAIIIFPTTAINNTHISLNSIHKNILKLITLAFMAGIILSLFLVFIIEFINVYKTKYVKVD